MSGLLGSLGLDEVPDDPNAIPDGRYKGIVKKDEIVVKKDDTVHHVLTYKVDDPESKYNKAERSEWFKLGTDAKREGPANKLVGFTATMEDQAKTWYKKRLKDLGLTEEGIANWTPGTLEGKKITFGTKKNDQWINISFVELREAPAGQPTAGSAITGAL